MRARHKDTKSPIIGTLETVPGIALTQDNAFTRKDDGTIEIEYAGETDVTWDGQETICDPKTNRPIYVCQDGAECTEADIELY